MQRRLINLFAVFVLSLMATSAIASFTVFNSESEAQNHCPNDQVVWLNLPTGIWHYKGTRWYGSTKSGAYVCEQEASKNGDRASLNGT